MSDRYGFSTITSELDADGVLTVTLSRPDRRNALDKKMHHELSLLFPRIADDEEVYAVVLAGAAGHFTIGADYNVMDANVDEGFPDGHPGLMVESARIALAVLAIRQPMIAAVEGYALGIGATLALFCDMIYMAEDARIGDPHVKAGMAAGDGGAVLWPLAIGMHRAKEYLMTGKMLTGEEAGRMGMANHVLPAGDVLAAATEMARSLALGPSVAIRFNKRLVNKDLEMKVAQVYDLSLALEAVSLESGEHRESVRAFLEKRPPKYR